MRNKSYQSEAYKDQQRPNYTCTSTEYNYTYNNKLHLKSPFVKVWTAILKALCSRDMAGTKKLKKTDNKGKSGWSEMSHIAGNLDWKQATKFA